MYFLEIVAKIFLEHDVIERNLEIFVAKKFRT